MAPPEPDADRVRRTPAAISARVLEETVILDLDHDRYTYLNGSAGLLWEELAEPRTVAELAARLVAEYGIEPERARDDAAMLVERLRKSDLITDDQRKT